MTSLLSPRRIDTPPIRSPVISCGIVDDAEPDAEPCASRPATSKHWRKSTSALSYPGQKIFDTGPTSSYVVPSTVTFDQLPRAAHSTATPFSMTQHLANLGTSGASTSTRSRSSNKTATPHAQLISCQSTGSVDSVPSRKPLIVPIVEAAAPILK